MFTRRRPVEEWSPTEIVEHAVFCLASDPKAMDVRAAMVLHHDPALLPESLLRRLAKEAGGAAEYVTLLLNYEETDQIDVVGGRKTAVVKDVLKTSTLDDAKLGALAWVGESASRYDFQHMPGLYQAAFVQAFSGYLAELDPVQFIWAMPSGQEGFLMVRDFPPRNDRPAPTDGRIFMVIPASGYRQMLRIRGF